MANDVQKTVFGGAVRVLDTAAMAEKVAQSAQRDQKGGAPDGSKFMNFSGKKGVMTLGTGTEARQVQPDEMWVVNIASFEDGWICWKGGSPAAKRMANIFTGVPVSTPDFNEFGPFDEKKGEGWQSAKAFVLKSLDYDDDQGYFSISSVSGNAAVADLLTEISGRLAAGMAAWPVIQCQKQSFTSKGFTNDKPVFVILGWLDDEGLAAISVPDAEVDIDALMIDATGAGAEAPPPPPEPTRRRRA